MPTESLLISINEKGALQVKRKIDRVGKSAKKTAKDVNLLKKALQGLGTIGLGIALVQSIKLMASFGQEMATVKAIANATEREFAQLEQTALDLGTNTRFTATQAAEGMKFLSRAGFTASETLVAVEDTLLLAQAGALDLGTAARLTAQAVRGFRLDVSEAAKVTDVLALAANSSNTDVTQLGDAIKFAAPAASGLGVSIEETVASIQLLSDAGLQGTLAGTGLRKALIALESPTKTQAKILNDLGVNLEDVKVSSVGMTKAFTVLRDAGLDTGTSYKLFGQRAGAVGEILTQVIPQLEKNTEKLNEADGTAKRVADTMDATLNGALLRVKSAAQGVVLQFGRLGADTGLTDLMNNLSVAIRFVAKNLETLLNTLITAGAVFAGIKLGRFIVAMKEVAAATLAAIVAERARTLALLDTAKAEAAKVTALLISTKAQAANALVVQGSNTTEFARAAILTQINALEVKNTAATTAMTAAQANYNRVAGTGAVVTNTLRNALIKLRVIITGHPIVLLVTILAALVTALIAFRNQIQLVGNDFITLGTVFQATWNVIKGENKTGTEEVKEGLEETGTTAKDVFQNVALFLLAMFKTVLQIIDKTIGVILGSLRGVTAVGFKLGESLKKGALPSATELGKAFTENFAAEFNRDAIGGVLEDILAESNRLAIKAKTDAVQKLRDERDAQLEKGDVTTEAPPTDPFVGPVQPTLDIAKFQGVLRALEQEGELLKLNNEERERRDALLEVEKELNFDLQGAQEEEVVALIAQNEQLALQANLLHSIKGPAMEYERSLAALNELKRTGAITADEFAKKEKELEDTFKNASKTATGLGDILKGTFNKARDALGSFIRTGKIGFTQLADSILADIARIAAQKAILNLVSGPLGFLGFQHGGAFTVGGAGGADSKLVQFAATPGEQVTVTPPGQQPTPQAAAPNITILNVSDPDEVPDMMESAKGEQVIINVVTRNRSTVRQAIA